MTRGGARRAIPWDEIDHRTLDARRRRTLGEAWLARARQEHLAVGAFARIAHALAEEGCEPVVLELVARAAADEVRHAELCARYAAAWLGEGAVPRRFRGVPKIPEHPDADPATRVLLHVVEMCCFSETFTGVYLGEMHARATESVARALLESLLEDEIDHGRAGWAYVAERARDGRLGGLAEALPALVARTTAGVLGASAEDDDPALEAHGWLGRTAAAAVYRRALSEVILPGFEAVGLDVTSLTPE